MRPPAALLDQLGRTRLMPATMAGSASIGERRSRRKGQGLEFIDHRPYREGDDTRHLDPHLYARTGEYYLREFARDQQLPVVVLLDTSPSMSAAGTAKLHLSQQLAQILGFIALAGGDSVRIATIDRKGIAVSDRWQGVARSENLFAWISERSASVGTPLAASAERLVKSLTEHALIITLSDWWDEDLPAAIAVLAQAGHTLLGIQILSATEQDPAKLGDGLMTIVDSESGEERAIVIDEHIVEQYREALETHRNHLLTAFRSRGWSFVSLSDEDDLADICLTKFRSLGVVS